MAAIWIGLLPESRRLGAHPPDVEEGEPTASAPPILPANWRGAVTFDADIQEDYDAWAGAPADFLWMTTGHDSWASFDNGFAASLAEFAADTRPIVWSLPLCVDGTSLAEVAGGEFDTHFTAAAEAMLAAAPEGNGAIIARLGWEANFTGLWSWTAIGVEGDYIAAWQRVHGLMRDVSSRFVFDWCLNYVNDPSDYEPETIYPGDAYVDVVSMDLYYRPLYASGTENPPSNPDPVGNFTYVKDTLPRGLDWIVSFAAAHEKPIAVPEWGCAWEKPQWVELAASWIGSLPNLVYHTYFDNNVDPTHQTRISDGSKGLAGHAYLMHFGEDVPTYGAAAIAGSVDGVIGAGGALPTGWGSSLSNVTVTVLGTDEIDGVACLRLRVAADGSGSDRHAQIYAPAAWGVVAPAEQNEVWRMAAGVKVEAQDSRGIAANGLATEIYEVDSSWGWLGSSGSGDDPYAYGDFPLYADHHTHARKLTTPGVARLTGAISIYLDASEVPCSVDLLIAAPVLMQEPPAA